MGESDASKVLPSLATVADLFLPNPEKNLLSLKLLFVPSGFRFALELSFPALSLSKESELMRKKFLILVLKFGLSWPLILLAEENERALKLRFSCCGGDALRGGPGEEEERLRSVVIEEWTRSRDWTAAVV